MESLPVAPHLILRDADFVSNLRHRLGTQPDPAVAAAYTCPCGARVQPADTDHCMPCLLSQGVRTFRHNLLGKAWRHIMCKAGLASTAEPPIRNLPGAQATAAADRAGARGDILLSIDGRMIVADVSVTHPTCTSYVAGAAQSAGSAAEKREKEKERKYESADPRGYRFVPLVVESYGRLGTKAMSFLNELATQAGLAGVDTAAFTTNALRELSVALCRGNEAVYRAGSGMSIGRTGTGFMQGNVCPTAEVDG